MPSDSPPPAQADGPGALAGVKVVELGGIGPTPFAAMLLGDMGADVIRVDRPSGQASLTVETASNAMLRNRRSVVLDLRRPECRAAVLRLVERSDVVLEGFRPGAAERLGLGPDECLAHNPKLVYGRMTGWGQNGPLAQSAGHDINYLARTGILAALGEQGRPPTVPLNLIGDFAGGGLPLAFGVVCATLAARAGSPGQVVDAAMVEGAALLATGLFSIVSQGRWKAERGQNLMDGGAPFYTVYEASDQRFVAVGAVEAKFYEAFLETMGLPSAWLEVQHDKSTWATIKQQIAERIREQPRDHWAAIFEGVDACVTPVLTFEEAPQDSQARARNSYVSVGDITFPAPAPRLAVTPAAVRQGPPDRLGVDTEAILAELGYSAGEVKALAALP